MQLKKAATGSPEKRMLIIKSGINVNAAKRPYAWNKEWVRPFESPYSVLRNFCRANVCKSINLAYMQITGERVSGSSTYRPEILVSSPMIPYRVSKTLFPKWYSKFVDEMAGFDDIYEPWVRYCPECMKEHYHSVFHNIRGVKKCFLHGCDLENVDVRYDLAQLTYEIDEDRNFNNVKNFILPCNRRVAPSFYNLSGFRIPEKLSILSIRSRTPLSFLTDMFFSNQNDPIFEFSPREIKSSVEFFEHVQREIASLKTLPIINLTQEDAVHEKLLRCHVDSKNALGSDISEACEYYLYYRRCKLMEERNKDLSEYEAFALLEELVSGVRITNKPSDDVLLRYSFVWGIYPVREPVDAVRYRVINSFHSCGRTRESKAYNCGFGEYISNYQPTESEQMDLKLIHMKILRDEFDFLWEEYQRLAARPEGVNSCDGWKELRFPEYYVIKEPDGVYKVYRN